jgi:hypothetical protein
VRGNQPVTLFFEARQIDVASLEQQLARHRLWKRHPDGRILLSPQVHERGVRLDFCTAEWFDLAAAVHVVVLCEAILREGARIEIVPPLPVERKSEKLWRASGPPQAFVAGLDARIARRERAAGILRRLNVVGALYSSAERYGAKSNLIVRAGVDTSAAADVGVEILPVGEESLAEADAFSGPVTEHARERRWYRMTPLRWLTFEDNADVDKFAHDVAHLLLDPDRAGFHPVDARALTNAVFHELLQNVSVHAASTRHALVAAWVRPSSQFIPIKSHLEHEQAYVEWLRTLQTPCLDLVIADSGEGANNSLAEAFHRRTQKDANVAALPAGDAQVLAWAWDRWSSRLDAVGRRGTRGLYRVDRVAQRHQGLAMLRAGSQSAGWDHGGVGYDRLVASTQPLAVVPGTVVRLLLPTLPVEQSPVRVSGGHTVGDVTIRWTYLGAPPDQTLTPEQSAILANAVAAAEVGKPVCVVTEFSGAPADVDLLQSILTLSEHAHPALLVVFGLSDDATLLRTAAEASQHEAEKHDLIDFARAPEGTDVGSPVLVIIPDGDVIWGGVPPWFAKVLSRLSEDPGTSINPEELLDLVPDESKRAEVYWRLRDTALAMRSGNGQISARVSVPNLVAEVRARLEAFVRTSVKASHDRVIWTPTLRLARAWISTAELWKSPGVDHSALFALAAITREGVADKDLDQATLVVDSSTLAVTAARLQRYLGCAQVVRLPHYAELAMLQGEPFLREAGPVVVYCDVVSSGESIQRALKQVLRDGGQPIAALCIVDGRPNTVHKIRVLAREFSLYSLVDSVPLIQDESVPQTGVNLKAEYISPLTARLEQSSSLDTSAHSDARAFGAEILPELIVAHGLHFTHVARPNGRHFTVWVDVKKLVALRCVRNGLKAAIAEWLRGLDAPQQSSSAIWYPASDVGDNTPLHRLADELRAELGPMCSVRPISRVPAFGRWMFPSAAEIGRAPERVIIIDTSSVEGGTISSLLRLAAECGAKSVLMCMPLCQLPAEQRILFESLSTTVVRALASGEGHQEELTLDPQLGVPHTASVTVRFLTQIQSSSYNSQTCPVCAQRHLISALHPNHPAMEDLRDEVLEASLRPRELREIGGEAVGVLGEVIAGDELAEILSWRTDLTNALTSTKSRWQLLEELQRLADAGTKTQPGVRERALLHLLLLESQWLALPPLEFALLRVCVGKIAARVIHDRSAQDASVRHAVIALRLAQTHQFAEEVETVLDIVAGRPLVEEQVLFSLYTFIDRPFHPVPHLLNELVLVLQRLSERVESGNLPLSSPAAASLLQFLHRRARRKRAEARADMLSPARAVQALRKHLHEVPHEVRRAFAAMSPYKSGNLREVVDDQTAYGASGELSASATGWLRKLPERTDILRQWVYENVVLYLRPLETLLQHPDSGLEPSFPDRLINLASDSLGKDAPDAEVLFSAASAMTQADDIPLKKDWNSFEVAYRWWAQNIIFEEEGKPPLQRWLESVPASVQIMAERLRERMREEERLCDVDPTGSAAMIPDVFAPQAFLDRVIENFVWDLVSGVPNSGIAVAIRLAPVRGSARSVRFSLSIQGAQAEGIDAANESPDYSSRAVDRLITRLEPLGAEVNAQRTTGPFERSYLFSFAAP